jgi:hypothetical protein
MNTESNAVHDDGLEWLRDIRSKLMAKAGGDLKRLGDIYRQTQAKHPEKVVDPRKLLTQAVHQLK